MSKFKVGDWVICTANTPVCGEGFIGSIVALSENRHWRVSSENNPEYVINLLESEMELLEDVTKSYAKIHVKPDAVNSPKHYSVFEKLEAIEVIASSMTADQFYGYCLGNILKYRLRAGGKDDVMQELGKADRYQGLYTEYKHLCKE